MVHIVGAAGAVQPAGVLHILLAVATYIHDIANSLG